MGPADTKGTGGSQATKAGRDATVAPDMHKLQAFTMDTAGSAETASDACPTSSCMTGSWHGGNALTVWVLGIWQGMAATAHPLTGRAKTRHQTKQKRHQRFMSPS